MFGKVVSHSDDGKQSSPIHSKRKQPRRYEDNCVVVVNGQMHPVENWSKCGLLMTADDRLYGKGQDCTFTLKFKLRDQIIEIDHKAKIARKAANKVALEFLPLSKNALSGFQKVVDDFVAQRFAESQTV